MSIRASSKSFLVVVAVFVACAIAGCGSSGSASKADAGVDGSSRSDATLSSDARSRVDAPGNGSHDARVQDAGGREAATDAAMPYGDRNLGLHEPYPTTLQIQNGGRIYDVRSPPASQQAALGDGMTDDTGAFIDAFEYLRDAYVAAANASPGTDPNGIYDASNYWIYVPAGTYRVTDTLTYRTAIALGDGGTYPDLVRIRIAGESRETTSLVLDNGAAGFGDSTHPKILLEYQHDGTSFNNWPASNLLSNLTINVGRSNPGAVAVWFQGANETVLYNVLLESGDGTGFCGLLVQTGSTHGYYRDFTVDGFANGICQIPTPNGSVLATPNIDSSTAFEHVTLRGQSAAGVLVQAGGTALRRLWVDESATSAVALEVEKVGDVVVIDDSLLSGTGPAAIARDTAGGDQYLYARDITTTGYAAALSAAGNVVLPAPFIGEYGSEAPFVLHDGGAATSLRLPIEDSPLVPWLDPSTDWASVDAYGADGGPDDSVAVQAAMSSGKAVVVFPRTHYEWKTAISIPPTVQRVDFLYADTPGALLIEEASTTPLLLTHHNGGSVVRSAARPLVMTGYSGDVSSTSATPADLFLENVVNMGDQATFTPTGQSTWARFIDDEQPNQVDVWANGGTLWVFGFKMENKPVPVFAATAGASLEVMNGEVAQTLEQGTTFMLRNDNSSMSFIGYTDLGYSPPFFFFTHILEETRGDAGTSLLYDGSVAAPLASRGWVSPGTYAVDIVVPLYAGRAIDAGP